MIILDTTELENEVELEDMKYFHREGINEANHSRNPMILAGELGLWDGADYGSSAAFNEFAFHEDVLGKDILDVVIHVEEYGDVCIELLHYDGSHKMYLYSVDMDKFEEFYGDRTGEYERLLYAVGFSQTHVYDEDVRSYTNILKYDAEVGYYFESLVADE